jgi:ATP-dependent DNA ligase
MITNKEFMLCDKIKEEELFRFVNVKYGIPQTENLYKANIKFDGERIVIIKKGDDVFLLNRAGRIKNQIYPEVVEKVKIIEGDFVLDSEVITLNGLFNSLQHRSNLGSKEKIDRAVKENPVKCVVFDLIFFDNIDLRHKPLKERIEILNNNFKDKVELVEYTDIQTALSFAKHHKLEGIVIKNMLSNYEGKRSSNWLKLKLFKQAEMKAISYTINNAGIRLEDNKQNAVQCSGNQSNEVKNEIDNKGYCDIVIQYLEKTKDDRFRFISFVGVKE